MSNFSYIYQGGRHTDTSREYMERLGMTSEQIDSVRSQYQYEASQVQALRRAAYASESDPLYIESQFDASPETEQAWRDKVQEIKDRYPFYPELD